MRRVLLLLGGFGHRSLGPSTLGICTVASPDDCTGESRGGNKNRKGGAGASQTLPEAKGRKKRNAQAERAAKEKFAVHLRSSTVVHVSNLHAAQCAATKLEAGRFRH
jgi:hypothetical protein